MAEHTIPVEAELTLFRPKMAAVRRRASDRYRCALASSGKLFLPATGESMTAWLSTLSATGIGINLSQPLEPGLDLILHLKLNGENTTLKLAARVVHCTPEVDNTWRVGCEFAEKLTPDVLDELL